GDAGAQLFAQQGPMPGLIPRQASRFHLASDQGTHRLSVDQQLKTLAGTGILRQCLTLGQVHGDDLGKRFARTRGREERILISRRRGWSWAFRSESLKLLGSRGAAVQDALG